MFNFKNQRKMKKVVRMLGLCALVALAFASCKKKETNGVTFKAGINQPTSNERTYINYRNMLAWSNNDVITVFDDNGEYHDFTVSSTGDVFSGEDCNGTFHVTDPALVTFLGNLGTKESYTAFYPVDSENITDGGRGLTVSLVIPDSQTYNTVDEFGQGSFSPNTYPMFAYNGAGTADSDEFMFHSDAGVVKFGFFNAPDHQIVVTDIVLTSDDPLVGTITYPIDYPTNPDYATALVGAMANTVTLTCNPGVVLGGGTNDIKYFNIVLLQGALANGFDVTINGTDNGSAFSHTIYCGATPQNEINAEKVTIFVSPLPRPE
jgi:hypothetical protein